MQLITNRTVHTPYGAYYAEAKQTGNVMTVSYFTIAKSPLTHNVEMPARIMERAAYEKMVKVKDPADGVTNEMEKDVHDREEAHKERTDLPKGKELSKGEEDALADVEDAKKNPHGSNGQDDDEYHMVEIDGPEAKEPKVNIAPHQKMNEEVEAASLRQAEEDDCFTAEAIREAMTELSEFDDKELRDQFISALGRPCCNLKDVKKEGYKEEDLSESTFNRLFNS